MTRLLYFSPVHASSYAQRPHFLVRACLEQGIESVLWVNPYPCRLPQWGDWRRGRATHNQGTVWDDRVNAVDVPSLPIEPLPAGAMVNRYLLWRRAWKTIAEFTADGKCVLGIGRPCALALRVLCQLPHRGSFYDAMDNFPEFHRGLSRRAMQQNEDAIADKVECVLASSTFLADKFVRRGLQVEKVLNACDLDGQNVIATGPAATSVPVLGYVGCIGRWFDWRLVIRLAKTLPGTKIELIGPCVAQPPEKLPRNVHLMPACHQTEVAGHLRRFSAGLIPFANDALTAGVDPIKYYEYRVAGLPVLSTSFGEMVLRGEDDSVFFLDQAADMAAIVEQALANSIGGKESMRFAQENCWANRFEKSSYLQSILPWSQKRLAA